MIQHVEGRKNRAQATINNAGRERKVEVMTEEGRDTRTRMRYYSYTSSDERRSKMKHDNV